ARIRLHLGGLSFIRLLAPCRPLCSHAFTVYDLVDISIFHLDIPAPADDNLYFQVTFSQGSRTPLLQGHFPHLRCPMAPFS
ncbi:hypothetical protein EDB85DRAFT_1997778, partial [Lactarius pseudohatsudake]